MFSPKQVCARQFVAEFFCPKVAKKISSRTSKWAHDAISVSTSRWPAVAMRLPYSPCCLGPNVYPEVPDGGWGWTVAVAFFLVEVCTYGTLKSLGVFLQDLMEEFEESNSRVSWVISICVFIFTFTGLSLNLYSCVLSFYTLLVPQACVKNQTSF